MVGAGVGLTQLVVQRSGSPPPASGPSVVMTGLRAGYARVGDQIDITVTGGTASAVSVRLAGVEVATSLPYTVPDNAGETLEVVATVDGSGISTGAKFIGKAPTVTVAIDQVAVDYADTLGADVTATATIVDAGFPELIAGAIVKGWTVDGEDAPAGTQITFAEVVQAFAVWSHPMENTGVGAAVSATRTVPAGVAPIVTVAIDQASVAAGDVIGTDVTATVTISEAGYPALTLGGIDVNWLVETSPAAEGLALDYGETVQAVAAWSHPMAPGGAGSALSATKTAPEAGAPWIMASGVWNDAGVWDDTAAWKDA